MILPFVVLLIYDTKIYRNTLFTLPYITIHFMPFGDIIKVFLLYVQNLVQPTITVN